MRSLRIVVVTILILLISLAAACSKTAKTPSASQGNSPPFVADIESFVVELRQSADAEISVADETSTKWMLADMTSATWHAGDEQTDQTYGVITLEVWHLHNEDLYYFLRYVPSDQVKGAAAPETVTFRLPIAFGDFRYTHLSYPQKIDHHQSVWSEVKHAKAPYELPDYAVFAYDEAKHAYLSYVQVFRRDDNDVRTELRDRRKALHLDESGEVVVTMPHIPGTMAEQWGMISAHSLADFENAEDLALLKLADLNLSRKWTIEGPLEITPSTYIPYSPTSFYVNPANWVPQKMLHYERSRFAQNMSLLALYTSVRTIHDDGYWPITTRSAWLWEDYGLKEFYYDTRWSTDAAVYLLQGYEKYRDPVFLETAKTYAAFYLDYAEEYHYATENGGMLVWDYYQPDNPELEPVHVSLNHLLAEMNFLYELYAATKDESYLATAHRIRTAVIDTHRSWKNDEGDLHYRYQPDGTYTGKDYPLLTLNDLRHSVRLMEEIEGIRVPEFEYLIETKEAYLKRNNMPLH